MACWLNIKFNTSSKHIKVRLKRGVYNIKAHTRLYSLSWVNLRSIVLGCEFYFIKVSDWYFTRVYCIYKAIFIQSCAKYCFGNQQLCHNVPLNKFFCWNVEYPKTNTKLVSAEIVCRWVFKEIHSLFVLVNFRIIFLNKFSQ